MWAKNFVLNVLQGTKAIVVWFFDKVNWQTVGAMATVVGVILTYKTVKYTLDTYKDQQYSNRPYFSVENTGIERNKNITPEFNHKLHLQYYNRGNRPASDFEGEYFFIQGNLKGEPSEKTKISIANDIPPNIPIVGYYDMDITENIGPVYIVIKMSYRDPVSQKKWEDQLFFLKWDGIVKEESFMPFWQISLDERNKIKEKLGI